MVGRSIPTSELTLIGVPETMTGIDALVVPLAKSAGLKIKKISSNQRRRVRRERHKSHFYNQG